MIGDPAPTATPDNIEQCNNGSSCQTGTYPWGFIIGGFTNIQLDIVGFLAILGEATVLNNAQVATLSWTCFLPRLIPAPQALIRTSRPERLDPASGVVVGPHSGNIQQSVNHVTNILHQIAFHEHKLGSATPPPYHVRAIKIDWAENTSHDISAALVHAVPGSPPKTSTKRKLVAKFKEHGPLAFLAYFGFLQSAGLLILSLWYADAMSALATVILSFVATLTGVANYWKLELPATVESRQRHELPPSDVIIKYPNGSFLVVTCPEEIARLYFASEQCQYMINGWGYRGLCLLGTILLMLGVICLANSTADLQIAWAAMYIATNAAYWGVAALPARTHWDLASFKTSAVDFKWYAYDKDDRGEWKDPQLLDGKIASKKATFTEALWKAVGITGGSHWARVADIAPDTNGWDSWLRRAEEACALKKLDGNTPENKMAGTIPPEAEVSSQQSDLAEKGKIVETKVIKLPAWNYRQELTTALQENPMKSRWSDFPKV